MKKTRKFLLTFLFAATLTVSAVPCRTEAMERPSLSYTFPSISYSPCTTDRRLSLK